MTCSLPPSFYYEDLQKRFRAQGNTTTIFRLFLEALVNTFVCEGKSFNFLILNYHRVQSGILSSHLSLAPTPP